MSFVLPRTVRPARRHLAPSRFAMTAVTAALALGVFAGTPALGADAKAPPATAPAAVAADAGDKPALEANAGKLVVVTGTVTTAEWSKSGKVMNVEFKDSPLLVAVFEKNKEAVNAAFGGDAAKAWAGAKITISGKLGVYGGKVKALEGRPQMIVVDPKQVTVVEPTPATPAAGTETKK